MAYVTNGKVILGSSFDYDNAVSEIASLIRVGSRTDGRLYLADICVGEKINPWAKCKPFAWQEDIFATDAKREEARKQVLYGLSFDGFNKLNNNPLVRVWTSYKFNQDLTGYPKRIRDFDGYNHNAVGGLELVDSTEVALNTSIKLETTKAANDGIELEDILSTFIGNNGNYYHYTDYDWVLVDPFGFVHSIQRYSSYDDLLAKIHDSSFIKTINVKSTFCSDGGYSVASVLSGNFYPYVVPPYSKSATTQYALWYVGLAGRNADYYGFAGGGDASKEWVYAKNHRLILNPKPIKDTRINLAGQSTSFSISNFTVNMAIGSVKEGRKFLYQDYCDNAEPIKLQVFNDDCVFLGIKISTLSANTIQYATFNNGSVANDYLRVFAVKEGTTKVYSANLGYYNGGTDGATPLVTSAALTGTGGTSNTGNAWSTGTFYFGVQDLFAKFPNETTIKLRLTVADQLGSFLQAPIINLELTKSGTNISSDTAKALYPSTRTTQWI